MLTKWINYNGPEDEEEKKPETSGSHADQINPNNDEYWKSRE